MKSGRRTSSSYHKPTAANVNQDNQQEEATMAKQHSKQNQNHKQNDVETVASVSTPVEALPEATGNLPSREEFLAQHGNVKNRAIRALHAKGLKVSEIAKFLDIKYQHARNVLLQPLGAKVPTVAVVEKAEEAA